MVAVVSAVLVIVGVLGIGVNQWQQRIAGTVVSAGSRPVDSSAGPTSETRPEATTAAESGGAPALPSTASTVLRVPVPRAVRLPTIDVAARVVPVGLRRDGALAIPDDVMLVGWYELGVPPGADRGSAVLVAHRDGRGQGRGVFYDLGRLDVGDRLTVRTATDETLAFRIVAGTRTTSSSRQCPSGTLGRPVDSRDRGQSTPVTRVGSCGSPVGALVPTSADVVDAAGSSDHNGRSWTLIRRYR